MEITMNVDKTIICENCKQVFAFTAGEQEFYASKGLPEPKYCLICRGIMKAQEKDPGSRAKKHR
jgi:hypothetical protein